MPRPKSELTGQRPRDLSARLTEEQHITYLRLGGSKWLRSLLIQEIIKARETTRATLHAKLDSVESRY